MLCARLWLMFVQLDVGMQILRVPSKANIADGPTRGRWGLLRELGSHYHAPMLPDWIHEFWRPFATDGSCVFGEAWQCVPVGMNDVIVDSGACGQ